MKKRRNEQTRKRRLTDRWQYRSKDTINQRRKKTRYRKKTWTVEDRRRAKARVYSYRPALMMRLVHIIYSDSKRDECMFFPP